ncbi:MAG: glycosyltransferase [Anaerolineae bacterium]|nr:glycosyltransferase [Anaerolineae bacterium]
MMENGFVGKSNVMKENLNLIYIIGTYPKLTTTFIDREISLLRKWGVNLHILSIKHPDTRLSPEQDSLLEDIIYMLPPSWLSLIGAHFRFVSLHPLAYWRTLFYLLTRSHPSVYSRFKTFLHFGQGVYAAHLLRHQPCDQIHAHFIDRAATVALVAGRLMNVPYSVTAHASDIYVNPILLPEKLSEAKFVATCTGFNEHHLAQQGEGLFNHKVNCIYHGLEISKYQPAVPPPPEKKLILGVGQLREKKGFSYLLKACQRLVAQGYEFKCHIAGEGPLRRTLEAQICELSLNDTVTLCGALSHSDVIEKYRQATVFVLPAVLGADGDRDGIPNVILEAMAMQLPVVSTQHSGIPEVVEDGLNGLLVPPADDKALADALARLLDSPDERRQMGLKGRQTVNRKFDLERNVKRLFAEFMARRQSDSTRGETKEKSMNQTKDYLSKHALFLVWGPPLYGPRSKVLTRELGINSLHFVYSTSRRGFWAAFTKYTYQTLKTLKILFQERPHVVFVQNPPSFAVLCVFLYCQLTQNKFIVDAHSDALQSWYWLWPKWLTRLWARAAITTLVTNEHFRDMIQSWGGDAFILRDIPTSFDKQDSYPMNGGFNVTVVNTFSGDEPLSEVLEASKELSNVHFYVTGKLERARPQILNQAPANVHFTGFLPDKAYYALLNTSHTVMCLTTRNHTMQRGACEALSLGKPIITSDWPLLREYFHQGTVHVPNTQEGIRQGVQKMMTRYTEYQSDIRDLQIAQRREWEMKVKTLMGLINNAVS